MEQTAPRHGPHDFAPPPNRRTGRRRWRRHRAVPLLVALLVGLPAVVQGAAPRRPGPDLATSEPTRIHRLGMAAVARTQVVGQTAEGDELADLRVVPLDPALAPDAVMRSRPFVIDPDAAAFCLC